MNNATLGDFLKELVNRLGGKSPKFFRTLKTIALILTAVAGIPTVLSMTGVILVGSTLLLITKIATIAGLVSTFISSLTVEAPTVVASVGFKSTVSPLTPVKTIELPYTEKSKS